MKSLSQIRQEYDRNYQAMRDVIAQMGGEEAIPGHRKRRTALFRRLRDLQRLEHHLDALENRLLNGLTPLN